MTPKDQAIAAGEVSGWEMKDHPFEIGQPLWIRQDIIGDVSHITPYIALGFYKGMLSGWFCMAVPENELTTEPYSIPCSWLTDISPHEKREAKIIQLSHYRRRIKHETVF